METPRPGPLLAWPSSRHLLICAVSCWVLALFMTGLVVGGKFEEWPGWQLVMWGWLSLLMANLAWLANPVFLLAAVLLYDGRRAIGLSLTALLLSLDIFRLGRVALDESGATAPVYAYGWGLTFWLGAMCLLVAAAGTRELERRESAVPPMRSLGLGLFAVVVGASVFFWQSDHSHANAAEKARLAGLAFKRGPVCAVDVRPPATQGRVDLSAGALELLNLEAPEPFGTVPEMLNWGVPVVRADGRDYAWQAVGSARILQSIPASSAAPAASLTAYKTTQGKLSRIAVKLTQGNSERWAIEQIWQRSGDDGFCPDYQSFPKVGEQPREWVVKALSLGTPEPVRGDGPALETPPTWTPVTASAQDGGLSNELASRDRLDGESIRARGCPPGVGWGRLSQKESKLLPYVRAKFLIGERAYHFDQGGQSALCAAQDIYFYSIVRHGNRPSDEYRLQIEKRSLPGFERDWIRHVEIDRGLRGASSRELFIDSVDEQKGQLMLTIFQPDAALRFRLTVPI